MPTPRRRFHPPSLGTMASRLALAACAARVAAAQAPTTPPTPGVVQATVAPPGPAPDVAAQLAPDARGRTLVVVNKLALTVGFHDAATGA